MITYNRKLARPNLKAVLYLTLGLIISIFFFIMAGFSFSTLMVFILAILGLLLFLYKKHAVLISYCLICETAFIAYFLLEFQSWPIWLVIILTILVCYLVFYYFFSLSAGIENTQTKTVYSLVLGLVISELLVAAIPLGIVILIKSLIITTFFYYFTGLLQLEHQNRFASSSVGLYSSIFFVIIVVLIYVGRI